MSGQGFAQMRAGIVFDYPVNPRVKDKPDLRIKEVQGSLTYGYKNVRNGSLKRLRGNIKAGHAIASGLMKNPSEGRSNANFAGTQILIVEFDNTETVLNSDLAPISISPIRKEFENNFKAKVFSNIGIEVNLLE